MKFDIYVEGISDKLTMQALLAPLLEEKSQQGISIDFFAVKGNNNDRGGDAKKDLLIKIPIKAVDIIRNKPATLVVIMPDLYPKNKGFAHETVRELESGIFNNFNQALYSKGIDDNRLREWLKVFCFKHDLESLILAAESQLRSVLGINALPMTWTQPVEDQNHNVPPRDIVERMFQRCGKKYKGSLDVPRILGNANYHDIADQCPQAFRPFVDFLENLYL